ncbi:SLAP domain-containing protein [Paraliobacillus sp. JSM ZJ581]|uniref:SLAP domain-containing protein n=1 Tax=Paraliobacillus sp. JSM ZJ581 TaxID=3342118 RepID=UPI0035A931FD
MQQLNFENAWNRTISNQDKQLIHHTFTHTCEENVAPIHFITLREAINHKGEYLIMTLIHNFSTMPFMFSDTTVYYLEKEQVIAKQRFSFPQLVIKEKTSMPWTFIFQENNFIHTPTLEDIALTIYPK